MDFKTAEKANGSVNMNGVKIAITQDPYSNNYGTDGGIRYYASGIDIKGNEYLIQWETTEEWDDATNRVKAASINDEDVDPVDASILQDEAHACDWENPAEVTLIEKAE